MFVLWIITSELFQSFQSLVVFNRRREETAGRWQTAAVCDCRVNRVPVGYACCLPSVCLSLWSPASLFLLHYHIFELHWRSLSAHLFLGVIRRWIRIITSQPTFFIYWRVFFFIWCLFLLRCELKYLSETMRKEKKPQVCSFIVSLLKKEVSLLCLLNSCDPECLNGHLRQVLLCLVGRDPSSL